MHIEIRRFLLGDTACIGELKLYDNQDKVVFSCFTLEEDKVGIERNKDLRIPIGEYNLRWHPSQKYTPRIQGALDKCGANCKTIGALHIYNDEVPKDRYILIHSGNSDTDTKGCILLGKSYKKDFISNSNLAIGEFYAKIIESKEDISNIKLKIVRDF